MVHDDDVGWDYVVHYDYDVGWDYVVHDDDVGGTMWYMMMV